MRRTDNATHFKSKENLNFWSERPGQHTEWLKMVWVEFGCPGHVKGPWDGLEAMAKSKVTLDIMHGKDHTSAGQITSPILVAHHLRTTIVSPCKGIMSCFSFGFLGVPRLLVRMLACATSRSPTPVEQISWCKVVRVPSRPFGRKTNLL